MNYYNQKNYKPNKTIGTIETDKKIYWTRERISQSFYTRYSLFKKCKKFIIKKKIKSVLDIGCGPAIKLMKFIYPVCSDVYGVDQKRIIEICKKKYGLNSFFFDDIENSNLDLKKTFDLIISTDVIEHLLNPDKLLNYIKKYSHDNTYIIISTPERDILRGKNCLYSPKEEHIREWNKKEFREYLKNNNFEIIFHRVIDNFRILLNFKQNLAEIRRDLSIQLGMIKRFNKLKKIVHCQFIICKLKNTSKSDNQIVIKLFDKSLEDHLRDILNLFLIRFRIFLFKLYQIHKRRN